MQPLWINHQNFSETHLLFTRNMSDLCSKMMHSLKLTSSANKYDKLLICKILCQAGIHVLPTSKLFNLV